MAHKGLHGTVKWFSKPKGFGWITPDPETRDIFRGGADDVFVHAAENRAFEYAEPGDGVDYDFNYEVKDPKKHWNYATNVWLHRRSTYEDHGWDQPESTGRDAQFSDQDRSKSKIPFPEKHFFDKRFVYF